MSMASGTSERRELIRISFDMEVKIGVEGRFLQAGKGINISSADFIFPPSMQS